MPVARRRSSSLLLLRAASVLPTMVLMTGCYRYVEAPLSSLQDGAEVRARLTGAGVDRLRTADPARAGVLQGFTVAGRVEGSSGDSLVISVDPRTATDVSMRANPDRIRVAVPKEDVRGADLRTIDRKKTAIVVGAFAAGTVIGAAIGLKFGGKSTGSTGNPPPPPESRVP